MKKERYGEESLKGVSIYLASLINRIGEYLNSVCRWDNSQTRVVGAFGRQAIPMVWDFPELNPFSQAVGSLSSMTRLGFKAIANLSEVSNYGSVTRVSATKLPYPDNFFDAIITDPPYYDNVPYADLSDFFYVWLKRSIGHLYPEHFSGELTPKKKEIIADAKRHRSEEGGRASRLSVLMKMMFIHNLKKL